MNAPKSPQGADVTCRCAHPLWASWRLPDVLGRAAQQRMACSRSRRVRWFFSALQRISSSPLILRHFTLPSPLAHRVVRAPSTNPTAPLSTCRYSAHKLLCPQRWSARTGSARIQDRTLVVRRRPSPALPSSGFLFSLLGMANPYSGPSTCAAATEQIPHDVELAESPIVSIPPTSEAGNHLEGSGAGAEVSVEEVVRKRENFALVYLRRLKGAGQPGLALFAPSWDGVPAFLFTAITLIVLAVIEYFGLEPYDLGMLSYLPSFGASCCLVMCLLTSPGAQPRALVFTHIVGAFLGVAWAHIFNSLPKPLSQQLACAFAVAIVTALMMLTGTLQPSASATTCLAAFHLYGQMHDQGFMFMVTPATLGPCVIVFLGWLFNNLIPWRHCYPVWW